MQLGGCYSYSIRVQECSIYFYGNNRILIMSAHVQAVLPFMLVISSALTRQCSNLASQRHVV